METELAGQDLSARVARMPDFVVGGRLCLDFANTVEPRGGPEGSAERREYLGDYGDLVAWALRVGLIDEPAAHRLLRAAERDRAAAAEVFRRALVLREAIYRVFWSIARGVEPPTADLELIAAEQVAALGRARLAPVDGRHRWTWPEGDALAWPLWAVAHSAVETLTTDDPARIKSCPGGPGAALPCAWLFYDATKNRARRWCTMADCGNATKARRLTERRRAARAGRKAADA